MTTESDNNSIIFKTLKIQKDALNQECTYFKKEFDYLQKLFQEMELHICLMLGKKMPTSRRLRELTNADIESLKEENIMKDVLKIENTYAKCKQNNTHLNS